MLKSKPLLILSNETYSNAIEFLWRNNFPLPQKTKIESTNHGFIIFEWSKGFSKSCNEFWKIQAFIYNNGNVFLEFIDYKIPIDQRSYVGFNFNFYKDKGNFSRTHYIYQLRKNHWVFIYRTDDFNSAINIVSKLNGFVKVKRFLNTENKPGGHWHHHDTNDRNILLFMNGVAIGGEVYNTFSPLEKNRIYNDPVYI